MENKKKQFLITFNNALARSDYELLLDWVTEDFQWIMIGKIEFKGKEQFSEALKEMKITKPANLSLYVITQEKKGCVNGNMKVKFLNEESLSFSFCDVYE